MQHHVPTHCSTTVRVALSAMLLMVGLVLPMRAQSGDATLAGVIRDSSGASVLTDPDPRVARAGERVAAYRCLRVVSPTRPTG